MADTNNILSHKRKRTVVSYAELNFEPSASDDERQDIGNDNLRSLESTTRALKCARPAGHNMKKPKKQFPFLSLPPELRDYIYELALTDTDGIGLVSRTKSFRRIIARANILKQPNSSLECDVYSKGVEESAQLIPNLLAVSKQIHAEGIGYLYKQPFILEDTMALHTFLAAIGGSNRLVLSDITINSWGDGRGTHKAMNVASLTFLSTCTNLRRLHFDCTIGWQRTPTQLARQLYRDGHYFLEAFGSANGRGGAAVDIIELNDMNFGQGSRYGWRVKESDVPEPAEFKMQFRKELRRLLSE